MAKQPPKNPKITEKALTETLQGIEAPDDAPRYSPRREASERSTLNHAKDPAREMEVGGMKFKRTRTGLDHSSKMTLDMPEEVLNPELKYRWVNENNGGIERKRERGYETVDKALVNGMETRRRVGTNKDGSAQYSVLMATPETWYNERQQSAEADRRSKEEGLISGQTDGKESLGGEFYMNKAAKIKH